MAEKEYIEREEAKNALALDYAYAAAELLDTVPTADVQEVRYGKWIVSKRKTRFSPNETKCSLCGYSYFTDNSYYNFCPHCGAKMDKE